MHSQVISMYILSRVNKIFFNPVVVVDDYCNKMYGPIQLVDVNIISRIEIKQDLHLMDIMIKKYLDEFMFENIFDIGKTLLYWKVFREYNVFDVWKNIDNSQLNIKQNSLYYFFKIIYKLPNNILDKILQKINKNYFNTKQYILNQKYKDEKTFYLEE